MSHVADLNEPCLFLIQYTSTKRTNLSDCHTRRLLVSVQYANIAHQFIALNLASVISDNLIAGQFRHSNELPISQNHNH